MMLDLAILTIGQAPRKDLIDDVRMLKEQGLQVEQFGLLDKFTDIQIKDLAPIDQEEVLVTVLRNGEQVILSKHKIIRALTEKVISLPPNKWTLLFCTGDFSKWNFPKNTLFPDRILINTIRGIAQNMKLGVIVPEKNQINDVMEKWKKGNFSIIAEASSPYEFNIIKLNNALVKLDKQGAKVIILDCMGYTKEMIADTLQYKHLSVIVSRDLIFNVLKVIL